MPNIFLLARSDGHTAQLTPEDAAHCTRVMRHGVGDVIAAVDGQGLYVEGPILQAGKDAVSFQITRTELNVGEPPAHTYLLIAPTKHRDRLEWLAEKAVELGCTHLWLVDTARTERAHLNLDRLTKILVAALKQSQRSRLPQLRHLPLTQAIQECPTDVRQIAAIGAPDALQPVGKALTAAYLIGPEGDFTPDEIALATQFGWAPVSLGNIRLRVETAGLFVLAARQAAML